MRSGASHEMPVRHRPPLEGKGRCRRVGSERRRGGVMFAGIQSTRLASSMLATLQGRLSRGIGRCVAALVVATTIAAPVRAEPTYPTPPLTEFVPWLTANRGAATAKGIIYFIRGWSEGLGLDDFHLAPYIMSRLNTAGWDVIVAKYPQGDVPSHMRYDSVPGAADFLKNRANALKNQGYKRIVVSGQSWGSWVAMAADQQKALPADVLWLIVPNIYGPKVFDTGEKNSLFKLNYTKFAALVPGLATPSVLNTFDGDRWEPGNRAELIRKHFAAVGVPSLVIDQPQGFSGHFAGWLPIYDYAYGACIEHFLDKPGAETCTPPALSNDDFRSIFRIGQVANADRKRVTFGDTLSGHDFVVFNLGLPNKQFHYLYSYKSATERDTMSPIAVVHEQVSYQNGQQCVGTVCTTLIAWADREYLEFDSNSGNLLAWWVEK